MKKVELLNKYLSNLAVLLIKLHNLHWNVVGQQFMSIHNFTESQYDTYFGYYDDVAEALKMQGQRPLVKILKTWKHTFRLYWKKEDFYMNFLLITK